MTNLQQIGRDGLPVTTGDETRRKAAFVELNREFGLFSFAKQVRQNGLEYFNAFLSSDLCNEKIAMLFGILPVAGRVVGHVKIKEITHSLNRSRVAHFNAKRENVTMGALRSAWTRSLDRDAAFAVNQPRKISKFVRHVINGRTNKYQIQELLAKKSANSVDTPRGQYRASSAQIECVGVCREHRPNPKGMMCSDLGSNVEKAAEMTASRDQRSNKGLPENQDAETAQILIYCCLGTNHRRKQGVLSDITTTLTS